MAIRIKVQTPLGCQTHQCVMVLWIWLLQESSNWYQIINTALSWYSLDWCLRNQTDAWRVRSTRRTPFKKTFDSYWLLRYYHTSVRCCLIGSDLPAADRVFACLRFVTSLYSSLYSFLVFLVGGIYLPPILWEEYIVQNWGIYYQGLPCRGILTGGSTTPCRRRMWRSSTKSPR